MKGYQIQEVLLKYAEERQLSGKRGSCVKLQKVLKDLKTADLSSTSSCTASKMKEGEKVKSTKPEVNKLKNPKASKNSTKSKKKTMLISSANSAQQEATLFFEKALGLITPQESRKGNSISFSSDDNNSQEIIPVITSSETVGQAVAKTSEWLQPSNNIQFGKTRSPSQTETGSLPSASTSKICQPEPFKTETELIPSPCTVSETPVQHIPDLTCETHSCAVANYVPIANSKSDISTYPLTSFTSLLNEECGQCLMHTHKIEALEEELSCLKQDYKHMEEKYQELQQACLKAPEKSSTSTCPTPTYEPKRGLRVPKSHYKIQDPTKPIPQGYVKLGGQRSEVVVESEWKESFDRRVKRKRASFKVKKMFDSFYDPWQLQGHNSRSIFLEPEPTPQIAKAIKLYATDELDLTECDFNKAFNSKAGTAKRAMHNISPEDALPKKVKNSK